MIRLSPEAVDLCLYDIFPNLGVLCLYPKVKVPSYLRASVLDVVILLYSRSDRIFS
jgi:hypothetical protein